MATSLIVEQGNQSLKYLAAKSFTTDETRLPLCVTRYYYKVWSRSYRKHLQINKTKQLKCIIEL